MKKRWASVILAATLMLSVIVFPRFNAKADYFTMRDITAAELVAEMNVGINIGNSFDSVGSSETSWGNPVVTRELIRAYRDAGFNTIRLPITWKYHMDGEGNPNAAWLDRIQDVVDWILAEDMYCIINTHHEQSWLNTNGSAMNSRKAIFRNLWTGIANKFIAYGDHLLFEGFNEILKKEGDWSGASESDYQNSNILSQTFVDAVRATGRNNKKRILISSTYGAIRDTYGFELPTDAVKDKLAVEFHSYDPQQLCFAWGNRTTFDTNDRIVIDNYCEEFYRKFVSQGVPVILGEFGAVNKGNTEERAKYTEYVMKTCTQYGIKAVWWDNGTVESSGDDFCIINRYNYKREFPEIISALVNNCTSTLPDEYFTSCLSTSATTRKTTTTTVTVSTTTTTRKTTTTTTGTIPTLPPLEQVPTLVLAAVTGKNTVSLKWEEIQGMKYYQIYRKFGSSSSYSLLNTILSTNCSFVDKTAKKGGTYYYKIKALNNLGQGTTFSNAKSVKTMNFSAVPTVKLTALKKGLRVTLSKKVTNASGYQIEYSLNKNMKSAKYVSVSASAKYKNVTKLKAKKKYYVRIRAYRTINGKKVYANWSSKKAITTKK